MSYSFSKLNRKVLQFDCQEESQKIILNHYIMRKENLNRMNGNLPQGQFPISVRTAAKDLNTSRGTIQRMLKEFEELKIIELIKNGKENKKYSIYKYISSSNENQPPKKNIGTYFGTRYGTSKIDNINRESNTFYQLQGEELDLWQNEFGL